MRGSQASLPQLMTFVSSEFRVPGCKLECLFHALLCCPTAADDQPSLNDVSSSGTSDSDDAPAVIPLRDFVSLRGPGPGAGVDADADAVDADNAALAGTRPSDNTALRLPFCYVGDGLKPVTAKDDALVDFHDVAPGDTRIGFLVAVLKKDENTFYRSTSYWPAFRYGLVDCRSPPCCALRTQRGSCK